MTFHPNLKKGYPPLPPPKPQKKIQVTGLGALDLEFVNINSIFKIQIYIGQE